MTNACRIGASAWMMPMTKLTLHCGWCDFTTMDPSGMVAHMLESGHGLSKSTQTEMCESAAPGELEVALGKIQRGEIAPDDIRRVCIDYQPDASGTCRNCDEPEAEHPPAAVMEQLRDRDRLRDKGPA